MARAQQELRRASPACPALHLTLTRALLRLAGPGEAAAAAMAALKGELAAPGLQLPAKLSFQKVVLLGPQGSVHPAPAPAPSPGSLAQGLRPPGGCTPT